MRRDRRTGVGETEFWIFVAPAIVALLAIGLMGLHL